VRAALARHLLAIAVLPFTMAIVIPAWLARDGRATLRLGAIPAELAAQVGGILLLMVGLTLFVASLRKFATEGEGTLAPWDPPRKLVVRGPYRYVRNPMISGVILVLLGEGLVLLSRVHVLWGLTFLGINAVYIPLFEEPQLASRFGDSYRDYCRHVPRLVPRLKPWRPM
jgi:protein-S-isoprenylcysteine O-methyltransferase Ste14